MSQIFLEYLGMLCVFLLERRICLNSGFGRYKTQDTEEKYRASPSALLWMSSFLLSTSVLARERKPKRKVKANAFARKHKSVALQ